MKKCEIIFKSVADGVSVDTKIMGEFDSIHNLSLISFHLANENETQKFAFSVLQDKSVRLTKSGDSNYSLIFKNEEETQSLLKSSGYSISLSTKTTYLNTQVNNDSILIDCKYILNIGGNQSFNSFYLFAKEI